MTNGFHDLLSRLVVPALALALSLSTVAAVHAQQEPRIELVVQTGHAFAAMAVSFSPDGKRLCSAGVDGAVRLWDVATGRELRKFPGGGVDLDAVAFGRSEDVFAAGGGDAAVLIWDLKSGMEPKRINAAHTRGITSVSFDPSGDLIATSSWDGTAAVWDRRTSKEVHRFVGHGGGVTSAIFDPAGRWLATSGTDRTLRFWSLRSGQEIKRILVPTVINSLAVSPNGRSLAGAGTDKFAYVWNVASGRVTQRFDADGGPVRWVAFDSAGRRLAAAGETGSVRLWDLGSGRSDVLTGHIGIVNSVAFAPDGTRLATAGDDLSVRIWDLNSPTHEVKTLGGYSSGVNSAVTSPDGSLIVSAHADEKLRLWSDPKRDLVVRPIEGERLGYSVALSPDASLVEASSRDDVCLIDVNSGKILQKHKAVKPGALYTAFSPKGDLYAVGGGNLQVWSVKDGREVANLKAHPDDVYALTFSHSGRLIATGSGDGVVNLWDTKTWDLKNRYVVPSGYVSSVKFSADDSMLAAGDNHEIFVWNTDTGAQKRRLIAGPQEGLVGSIAFSPDGKILASSFNNKIQLWDVGTGTSFKTLSGHDSVVSSIEFTVDGNMILSSSIDSTIRLWDVPSGEELVSLIPIEGDGWVTVTPDGRFDTNRDLDRIDRLAFRFSDEPLAPKSLNLFMRQYYEPGLLRRLLDCHSKGNEACKKEFKALPAVGTINRVQSQLKAPAVGHRD